MIIEAAISLFFRNRSMSEGVPEGEKMERVSSSTMCVNRVGRRLNMPWRSQMSDESTKHCIAVGAMSPIGGVAVVGFLLVVSVSSVSSVIGCRRD